MALIPLFLLATAVAGPKEELPLIYKAVDTAYTARDADQVAKFLAADFRSQADDADRNRDQVVEGLKGLFPDISSGRFFTQIHEIVPSADGGVATVARRARITLKEPIPGMKSDLLIVQARIEKWRKDGDGWKMIRSDETALERELRAMVVEDQKARLVDGPTGRMRESDIADIDAKHLPRLKQIVALQGWPKVSRVGTQGAHNMWLLVQHMDRDKAFQNWCLRLMEPLVEQEEAEASDFAYLTDRVRVNSNQPQLYGTQWHKDAKGEFVPRPVEDPAGLEARRKKLGLPTMAEYKGQLEKIYGKG